MLTDAVDAFWVHAAPPPATRVYPDGCIDLVFRARRRPDGALAEAHLFVAGASTRPYDVPAPEGTQFVGVRFRPGMSRLAVDAAPPDLAGRDTPALDADPSYARLLDRLAGCPTPEDAARELRAEVAVRVARRRGRPPRRVREALALLGRPDPDDDAPPRVARIARSLGVTERTLRRDVLAWTGLAPRTLARILRFQAALAAVRSGEGASLARVSQALGYADQPHMAREFAALAGSPPSAFR